MNTTNAPTAEPAVITPKTSVTDTATGAAFGTAPTIKSFIEQQFAIVRSEDFSGIKHMAERLDQFGFKRSANLRYAGFLEAFQANPLLADHYAERYPNCFFLPWKAFHTVRRTLDLWCDLPEFYCGAVPGEQIPWLEAFSLHPDDAPFVRFDRSVEDDLPWVDDDFLSALEFPEATTRLLQYSLGGAVGAHVRWLSKLSQPLREFRREFFVVAPAQAFSTTEDWLERTRKMAMAAMEETSPPPDPLVIRFCRGGCLVVAAWGDEATELNELVKTLNLHTK